MTLLSADEAAWKSGDRSASIHKELVFSQIPSHQPYGGVVPELAAREHLERFPILLREIFEGTPYTLDNVTHFCATRGPGLKGCLLMGHSFAKGLAAGVGKPFIGVNHLEGHLCAALIDTPSLTPPFLALLVSGGHTQLLYAHAWGEYELLSETRDDAVGEAFDKSASLLGFPYPGGASLARLADEWDLQRDSSSEVFKLPLAMKGQKDLSFSGLKTAISALVTRLEHGGMLQSALGAVASSVQRAIIESLLDKVVPALHHYGDLPLVVTGGCAANQSLRKALLQRGIKILCPHPRHCTDNATMIAYAAMLRLTRNEGRYSSLSETVLPRYDLSISAALAESGERPHCSQVRQPESLFH
jgi:N6-L-threonylcarbamoyladenine synthase